MLMMQCCKEERYIYVCVHPCGEERYGIIWVCVCIPVVRLHRKRDSNYRQRRVNTTVRLYVILIVSLYGLKYLIDFLWCIFICAVIR